MFSKQTLEIIRNMIIGFKKWHLSQTSGIKYFKKTGSNFFWPGPSRSLWRWTSCCWVTGWPAASFFPPLRGWRRCSASLFFLGAAAASCREKKTRYTRVHKLYYYQSTTPTTSAVIADARHYVAWFHPVGVDRIQPVLSVTAKF